MGFWAELYLYFGTSAGYRNNLFKDYWVQTGVALPYLVSRIAFCWTTQRNMNGPQGIVPKAVNFQFNFFFGMGMGIIGIVMILCLVRLDEG